MSEVAVITQPLGGSALSRAARDGRLADWYPPAPRSASEWAAYGRDVAASVAPDWLARLEPAIVPRGAAGERLRRASAAKGVVVTTGQQAGLFGGPLMTFVKALSARAHADVLQELLGVPVAPVFWAATDDADFEEGAVVSVALPDGARDLRLVTRPPAATPAARAPIGDEVASLEAVLRGAFGSGAYASLVDGLRHFHAGATLGGAYVALLRDVLEPLEISVLDASHLAVVAAAAPLLGRAASSATAAAQALHRRNADIAQAGYEPQVVEVEGMSLVFLNENGIKRRLPIAEAEALGAPPSGATLSPTALLRPLAERSMLPTIAYVGGPAEVAYFAQVSAVAAALGTPAPLVVPRWSATILEPRVRRTLEELGLDADAFADPHRAEGIVAGRQLPDEAVAALAALRRDVEQDLARLAAGGGGLVPDAVLEGFKRNAAHHVERLERRFLAGVKRREAELLRRVATARASLYPFGVRQERKLAWVAFVARYGEPLIEQMLAAARAHARALVQPPASSAATAPTATVRV